MKKINARSSLLLAASIAALFMPIACQAEAKNSAQYEKCMDDVDLGASKNAQWSACHTQELKRLDVTLNSEYSKLRKSSSPEQRDALMTGQRAWLKYREDWCRYEQIGPMAPGGEANYTSCLLSATVKQVELLKDLN
jgi:uncharacterized protein YecT (DUF1311 family)